MKYRIWKKNRTIITRPILICPEVLIKNPSVNEFEISIEMKFGLFNTFLDISSCSIAEIVSGTVMYKIAR
jgi:hypothetical protein